MTDSGAGSTTVVIYLAAFFLLLAASSITFLILFRRDYRRYGRVTFFPALLGSAVYFAWGGFPYIYSPPDWPEAHLGPIQTALGYMLLWGGLSVLLLSMAWLGLLKSLGQRQSALQESGPYRFSRNPQVLGVILYGLGFTLLWPSWYALGWMVMILAITRLMLVSEEEHLRHIYGEAYERYCKKVPRYIGPL